MRVAALYDIHGNLPALQAVFDDVERCEVDRIVVGGDVVLGPMSNECLSFLESIPIPISYIKGNCEVAILNQLKNKLPDSFPDAIKRQIEWTASSLSTLHQSMLANWPATVTLEIAGLGNVLFCHATPQNENDIFTKFTPIEKLLSIFEPVKEPIVMCGHTHMQFDIQVAAARVVNAGSVGMPFGKPGAYWALLNEKIELMHTLYDFNKASEIIKQSSYPQANEFAENHVLNPPTEDVMLEKLGKAEI